MSTYGGEDVAIYSVDSGVPWAPFVASTTINSLYFYWVYENETLSWNNALFLNGTAAFCLFDTGAIDAYFTVAPPDTCNRVYFTTRPGKISINWQPHLLTVGSG